MGISCAIQIEKQNVKNVALALDNVFFMFYSMNKTSI